MVWKPHVTVAAVIENNDKFLLVEEETPDGLAFNQPAGHLEKAESIIAAVKREVNEETAWHFTPESIISIQLWRKTPEFPTFLRVAFAGNVQHHNPKQILDEGIVNTHWLSRKQIIDNNIPLRSPLVLTTIDDYLAGQRYPLSLLKSYLDLEHE